MAIWQCDFHIRPKKLVEVKGALPITVSGTEQSELESLWGGDYSIDDLPVALTEILPERSSWSKRIRTWGMDDGDRVDLSGDNGNLEEWFVRFDLRRPNFSFFHAIIDLAQRYNGVFVSPRNYVIPPSYTKLLDHIRRSDSFKFVQNPEKFLEELSLRLDKECDESGVCD